MKKKNETPYDALKKIFHEPNRLAIMSTLCAAVGHQMTFNELKKTCALTDGNLNRHLKTLQDVEAVRIEKKFVGVKPRTTVFLTETGLRHFQDYLDALTEVLEKAKAALPTENRRMAREPLERPLPAV